MGQRVSDDVDSHRVGLFDAELVEKLSVFAFAFPTVLKIVVVADQDHHAAVDVVETKKVRLMIHFRSHDWMIGNAASLPEVNRGDLRDEIEIVDVVKNLVRQI